MKVRTYRAAATGILFAALLPFSAAHAQLGNLLPGGGSNSSSSGGLGSLGGLGSSLSGSSLTSGSTGNVAGVLQFCIKNNYLSGDSASSVKDSLMSKLPGGSSTSDSGYTQGSQGILSGSNGKQVDLSGGGGLKEQVTKQVCDKILSQGKSLL
ncbi:MULTISPECIES: DUF2501 domain-containing protein [Paraburkholderia]|uniref:DUF2501 domain-containing protein n=1 Tax=Paraburkholderia megapolitana TaxID=420953 RepID=A0A1I3JIR3_9BURK|nr:MULTISPECIES: DUF2501 domain-containing protein [Paraburkholderia]MCX4160684.1 DUF2501 domain-containing protein [Paraburkholderia megapolitana]MDN7156181.1 DUF2501 domain-containing protein [Paraburkholderia sp. CHISQ3]MDQ6493226.1 DUF2501 domain-containing protein [Paraburkholderia megapolitana]QDQ84781.1 DUF2501 domain-containing protein [Paraburkholderia megapolitana]SFI60139.1 Protein of unknown function [Paraburkholderia megapolitana]